MDVDQLPAVSGPGLSSPHLRTTSASEPPRSIVLLGKRGEWEGEGGDTPASMRSVRQRLDSTTGLPFMLPQPLFTSGGLPAAAATGTGGLAAAAAAAAGQQPDDLAAAAGGDPAAAAAAAMGYDQQQQQQQRPGSSGTSGLQQEAAAAAAAAAAAPAAAAAAASARRAGQRGGSSRRKQQQAAAAAAAARNRRKPLRRGQREWQRGVARPVKPPLDPAAAAAAALLQPPPAARGEAALRHLLGSGRLRQWAMAEWHYSAIDRPFFLKNEMQELLTHAGLGHVSHLTRLEWSVVRGAFGRPRRLSVAFLKQERARLEAHRDRVRAAYEAVGVGNEVPPELPRPLKVGQAVVARHPGTRSLADGIVLTIKPRQYRVQFNRTDLMTQVVRDTDVMPIDPAEALPPLLLNTPATPPLLNGRPTAATTAAALAAHRRQQQQQQQQAAAAALVQQHKQQQAQMRMAQAAAAAAASNAAAAGAGAGGSAAAAAPAGEGGSSGQPDQQLLSDFSGALNRKQDLLSRLQALNSTAEAGRHLDPATCQPSEAFQTSYGAVLAALQAANGEIQALSLRLQARPHLAAAATAAAGGVAAGDAAAGAAAGTTPAAAAGAALAAAGGNVAAVQEAAAAGAGSGEAAAAAAVAAAGVLDAAQAAARGIVQRIRTTQQVDAAAAAAAAPAAAVAADERRLDDVITGCIGLLLAVHQLTTPPGAEQQQGQVQGPQGGVGCVEATLDAALRQLQPRAAANRQRYDQLVQSVGRLKAQLTAAH